MLIASVFRRVAPRSRRLAGGMAAALAAATISSAVSGLTAVAAGSSNPLRHHPDFDNLRTIRSASSHAGILPARAPTTAQTDPACDAQFHVVPGANPSIFDAIFNNSLAAAGPNDIWAVGGQNAGGTNSPDQTLTDHWNGTSWSNVDSSNTNTGSNLDNDFWSVSVVPGSSSSVNNTFAVGGGFDVSNVDHPIAAKTLLLLPTPAR